MARIPARPLDTLGHFRGILDAIVEGGIIPSGGYERLRRTLLADGELAPYLPDWLRSVRTENEFKAMVRSHRSDPLGFIRDAFEPAYRFLEAEEFDVDSPANLHPLFRRVSPGRSADSEPRKTTEGKTPRIFIVHGHDIGRREAVGRFVDRLGFEAVILAEQPDGGRTIIEKFEAHSDVDYAIALMTPDDVGSAGGGILRPRARQNVVLEHGFFIGLLGRKNVVALVVGDIEKASDISGLLYVPWDDRGAWKVRLADEMKAAGLPVDKNRL